MLGKRSLSPNQNIPKSDRSPPTKTFQKAIALPTKTPQKAIALARSQSFALHQNISKSDRYLYRLYFC
jgi:hypothetical protein